jgi:hypothetical protein
MKAFDFTDEDLDANRHGYLTKEQRVKLRNKGSVHAGVGWAGAINLAFVWVLLMVMVLRNSSPYPTIVQYVVVVTFLFGTPIAFCIASAIRIRERFKVDLEKCDVCMVRGRVSISLAEGGTALWPFELKIKHTGFHISWRQKWAFKDRGFYEIYYTPVSRSIVSVERAQR